MERLFQVSALVLWGVAGYFLWRGDSENAFVLAVLGCVSFFLGIRFQMKGRTLERERERRLELDREDEARDEPDTRHR